jgi:hypothetical protein
VWSAGQTATTGGRQPYAILATDPVWLDSRLIAAVTGVVRPNTMAINKTAIGKTPAYPMIPTFRIMKLPTATPTSPIRQRLPASSSSARSHR